jgi:hypothetical protein
MRSTRTNRAQRCLAVLGALASVAGTGAPEHGLLRVDISAATAARLDELERGELKISWRQAGPELRLGAIESGRDEAPVLERRSAAPKVDGCFLLAPFEFTTRNRLGGGVRVAGRAKTTLTSAGKDRALRFEFSDGGSTPRVELGLFDPDESSGAIFYLNGDAFDRFVLRVRQRGDGQLTATLVDAYGRRGPAVTLDKRGTDEWHDISIGTQADGIHGHHLATLELRAVGSGHLDIDDVHVCRTGAVPQRRPGTPPPTRNSLWVWHTKDLLAGGGGAVAELLDLAQQAGVRRIYLQVPSHLDEPGVQRDLRTAITAITAAGVELLALDGAPGYALPGGRRELGQTVARILDYNRAAPPGAQFSGIHLDVEPYLLPEWGRDRDAVISSFLAMLEEVGAQAATDDLVLDVALPFWFDGVAVREPAGDSFTTTSLTAEVLRRADSIAVMDYRTEVGTSNGVLALGAAELATGAELGRHVWLGLETTRLPDETFVRFRGTSAAGLPEGADRAWWVVEAAGALWAIRGTELAGLADQLGADEIATARHWKAHAVEVPASRQTFYDLGFDKLIEVMAEASAQLDGNPAFAGFALHYDRPLRRLLEASER